MPEPRVCPRCAQKSLYLVERYNYGTPDESGFVAIEVWACACGYREERDVS